MTTLLLTVSCVSLAIGLYSFTLYPLSLIALRHFKGSPTDNYEAEAQEALPSFSIVLCAYNEEKSIGDKLSNLSKVAEAYAGTCEIRIYLDACSDGTAEIVKEKTSILNLECPLTVVEGSSRSGKSHGMNTLLGGATGDIVLFTDANVELDEQCLLAAANAFREPGLGCICGNLKYLNETDSATAEVGSLYWRFEEWLKQLESDTGSTVSADGSLFAIRRELFRPVPVDIIDDMYTSMGVLIQGYKIARREDFRAYELHTVSPSDEFRRKIRIACRSVNCYRLLRPKFRNLMPLDRYKLTAHKALRWSTIFWLCIGVLSFAAFLLVRGAFLTFLGLAATCVFLGLAGSLGISPFASLMETLRALVATGIGVVDSFRGKRYQTWGIAASSRAP